MRKLAGLQFRFAYKKWSENIVVDALSRVGAHLELQAIFCCYSCLGAGSN
jgi:hypothetical protein